jgi:hypothetical protein
MLSPLLSDSGAGTYPMAAGVVHPFIAITRRRWTSILLLRGLTIRKALFYVKTLSKKIHPIFACL